MLTSKGMTSVNRFLKYVRAVGIDSLVSVNPRKKAENSTSMAIVVEAREDDVLRMLATPEITEA